MSSLSLGVVRKVVGVVAVEEVDVEALLIVSLPVLLRK